MLKSVSYTHLIIISTIYWYIKNNKIKFEKMFLIVGSMLSCMFIVLLPNRLNISYDDQIHYKNIVALSHYPDKSVSAVSYTHLDVYKRQTLW